MAWRVSDFAQAGAANAEALAFFETSEDFANLVEALIMKAHLLYYTGEAAASLPVYEEALAMARKSGDRSGIATSLGNLGVWHMRQGTPEMARVYLDEQVELRRQSRDRAALSTALYNLGAVMDLLGDTEGARQVWTESLTLSRETGNRLATASVLTSLGNLAMMNGFLSDATTAYQEALSLCFEIEARWDSIVGMESLAILANRAGDFRHAVRLFAATDTLRNIIGSRELAPNIDTVDAAFAACVSQYGESQAATLRAESRTLSLEAAVTAALAWHVPDSAAYLPPVES